MKKIVLVVVLLVCSFLSGCSATLQNLEESNGSVYTEEYKSPINVVYKATKSALFNSQCNARNVIYDDELNYKFYGKSLPAGMFYAGEYMYIIALEATNKNTTKVNIRWTPYMVSGEDKCTKELFDGIKSMLEKIK